MYSHSRYDIGAVVREIRTQHGLTQAELASKIGASRHSVIRLEQGASGVELGTALKALHALGAALQVIKKGQGAQQGHPSSSRSSARSRRE
jgi:transcriptional regulator with XRE-family HTH domain